MMCTSDAPGCEDISEARGCDELVVEEFFDAATDDEDYDVAEYPTGDETEGFLAHDRSVCLHLSPKSQGECAQDPSSGEKVAPYLVRPTTTPHAKKMEQKKTITVHPG